MLTHLPARAQRAAIVLAALVVIVPTRAHAQSANSSALERGVDTSLKPGDDFFAYANGSWLKATTLPAGKARWGSRDDVSALTRLRVAQLIDDARTAPAGSPGKQVADFRAAWLNEAAIEAKGITPLRPALDSIARLQDKSALSALLGKWVAGDVDPLNWGVYQSAHLIGLSVETSIHGEKTFVAFLVQGGLGLPRREQYLGSEPAMKSLRGEYQAYIAKLLTLAGFDYTQKRAAAVLALEMALAEREATPDASANDHNADSVWTHADFASQAPGMDWPAFLAAAGLGHEATIGAWQPGALRGIAALVGSEPLTVWQDYLRFHLLDEHAEVLPRDVAEAARAMRSAAGGAAATPRAARALEVTQVAMSDAIGQLYAQKYFPPEQKARVVGVVNAVRAAFLRRIEASTWMSPASKAKALAKVRGLYVGIGYPDRWPPLTDLRIDAADALGNVRRVADRNLRQNLARLGQPARRSEWLIPPQNPGALLNFQQNAYDFSAALLQPPKFDPSASDAAVYGSIGAIIGHDIVHFVDRLGADYEVDGAMHGWWSAEERARFDSMGAPLVKQFSAYEPFPGVHVDGAVGLSENTADIVGLTAAFDAYRRALGPRLRDKEYVRRHDREFFLAFAQGYRVRFSDAGLRAQSATDHAPENYRVATVRNLDAWYDAFGVVPSDRLYLAPDARVRIW
ncbi:MAG: M13 family metallopeptidase [Gemmatimonadota bacterium]